MSQVSRPFQIALVAMVLLVMVWFVALRGHGSPSEPTPAPSPSSQSKTYTGAAPGVAGLSKDIAKAHGAARAEEHSARDEAGKSSKLTGEAPSTGAAPSAASSAAHGSGSASKPGVSAASKSAAQAHEKTSPGTSAKSAANAKRRQAVIKHELARGKVVLLMFWNPKSSDDQSVRGQLHDVSRRNGRVAVHLALPFEVGQFGGYTQGIQILQTPTILVVGGKGQTTTLTGLNDARTIQQAIGDAVRGGAGKTLAPKFTAWVHGSSRSEFIAKAEAICTHKKFYIATTKKQFAADLAKVVTSGKGFKSKMVKLAPVADRAYIARITDLALRGLAQTRSAFTGKVGAFKSRELLLEGQQRLDQAYNGYQSYGITNCVELTG